MNNIGYDVEAFLRNARGYIPAERVLAGTKGRGSAIGPGVLAHPDNVMAEWSSAAPFDSSNLYERFTNDTNIMRQHVAPVELSFASSIVLSEALLDESSLAGEIGCSADYEYSSMRGRLDADTLGNTRHAGGHIHFDLNNHLPHGWAAGVADIMLAVPLISMGEQQGARRSVYGLPGLNRPKSYGFEYRTLSNYWGRLIVEGVGSGKEFCLLVDRLARAYVELDESILNLPMTYGDYAKEIIINEDRDEASNLYQIIRRL